MNLPGTDKKAQNLSLPFHHYSVYLFVSFYPFKKGAKINCSLSGINSGMTSRISITHFIMDKSRDGYVKIYGLHRTLQEFKPYFDDDYFSNFLNRFV